MYFVKKLANYIKYDPHKRKKKKKNQVYILRFFGLFDWNGEDDGWIGGESLGRVRERWEFCFWERENEWNGGGKKEIEKSKKEILF